MDALETKEFDLNQVWEQIQLFNSPAIEMLDEWLEGLAAKVEDVDIESEVEVNEYDAMLGNDDSLLGEPSNPYE